MPTREFDDRNITWRPVEGIDHLCVGAFGLPEFRALDDARPASAA